MSERMFDQPADRPFKVGDRIKRTRYQPATFLLTGRTSRGKLIFRDEVTGAVLSTRWVSVADMPEHYEVADD